MSKNLYMATFTLVDDEPGRPEVETPRSRLVWALTEQQAELLLKREYDSRDSFGGERRMTGLHIEEALGTPDDQVD